MATRKRKTVYPPARTERSRPRGRSGTRTIVRPTVATIDLNAGNGRAGLSVGDRVRIAGGGLYAGEAAVIERLTSASSGSSRADGGGPHATGRIIDLELIARDDHVDRPDRLHRNPDRGWSRPGRSNRVDAGHTPDARAGRREGRAGGVVLAGSAEDRGRGGPQQFREPGDPAPGDARRPGAASTSRSLQSAQVRARSRSWSTISM